MRKLIHNCRICKWFKGVGYKIPRPADLPEGRVQATTAFVDVGIDFAGPLYVKFVSDLQKAYICIFTCSSSRAIHLETVPNLSTAAFIRCLKKYIARRVLPNVITSDNAKTFKNANKEIGKLLKSAEVQEYVAQKNIVWKFILERAPWFRGFYERMVQAVKQPLRKILGNARIDHGELTTAVAEIEGVVNSRPLTYICSDEFKEPITPAHLVIGRRILNLPIHDVDEEDEYDFTTIEKRARHLCTLLGHFWARWKNEYLLSPRELHRLKSTNQKGAEVQEGDVVVVKESGASRNTWKLAVVEQLITSGENEVRGAAARVVNGRGRLSRINRPLKTLYPLEVMQQKELSFF